jgi:saccharopine dehydrogenase-like NADP-dependent oxidoreductase
VQFKANPNFIANSITFLFITGFDPGIPKQVTHKEVFGLFGSVEQLQNNLDFTLS